MNNRRRTAWFRRGQGVVSPTLGKIWTAATTNHGMLNCYGVATNGSRVVMVADGGTNPFAYSDDFGDTWTRPTSVNQRWRDVCYSPDLDLFVKVSLNGTQRISTSPDGINWTLRTHSLSISWLGICWGNGLLVAVGQTGGCMTSPDGINWTTRTTPSGSADYRRVVFVPDLGLFIAAGVNVIITSPDGINWTLRTMPVTFSVGGMSYNGSNVVFNKFNSSTDIAVYSSDGTTWTASASLHPIARTGQSIVYGQGRFFSLTGGDIQISTDDGVTWSNSGVVQPPGSSPLINCGIFVNDKIIQHNNNNGVLISQ